MAPQFYCYKFNSESWILLFYILILDNSPKFKVRHTIFRCIFPHFDATICVNLFRRNLGRFFLIILALQSADKINGLLQEVYIKDLSLPFYELEQNIPNTSMETKVCQFMGFLTTFFDYMSQFYALWFAVLIQHIVKDPIHKIGKLIGFFHFITLLLSATLTAILAQFNSFGVQVSQRVNSSF